MRGPPRCHALTRSGTPCRNRVLPGGDFCRLHTRASLPEPDRVPPSSPHTADLAGLEALLRDPALLAATLADPAERMRLLATLMANRALLAHHLASSDPTLDTDDADARIARAVRTATAATRVELAARETQTDETGTDPDAASDQETFDDRRKRLASLLDLLRPDQND